MIFYKENKKLENIEFFDSNKEIVNLKNYQEKLIILNFWATWCAPCREEMPSLNNLKVSKKFNNLEIFPINVGREDLSKSQDFYNKLNIKNLKIYMDSSTKLANTFSLRGVPTSIFINKKGEEFARILGSANFEDENLINWLKKFD